VEKQRRQGNNFKGDIQALPGVTAPRQVATMNRAPANTHMQILRTPKKLSGTQRKHRVTLRSKKMQRCGMTDNETTSNFRNHLRLNHLRISNGALSGIIGLLEIELIDIGS